MGMLPDPGTRPPLFSSRRLHLWAVLLALLALMLQHPALAQDGSTSLQGVVEDISGARIAAAVITVVDPAKGFRLESVADAQGQFNFGMLSPGRYDVSASAPGMITKTTHGVELYVGGVSVVQVRLPLAGVTETVTVREQPEAVESQVGDVSQVITQQAIQSLPLNGRRFTDLALLTPGVTQDPRGLTSDSNGDLSFGGTRGFQNSFLVDGTDNNNSFFAQARGRYRAPYQFSNEVVKEFRVSSNAYSAELGKAGGAVFNVVTKSGTNDWHGSGFYYLRDRIFDASQAYVTSEPDDRQQQFGGTIGGPIRKDHVFFYAGFDQHLLTMPSVMQFANGASSVVVPHRRLRLHRSATRHRCCTATERDGRRLSHHDAGQCGIRQVRFHPLAEAIGIPAAEHLALQRHQQRVLRSLQPHHHLCGKRQRNRRR